MRHERERVNLSTTKSRIRGGLKFGDEQGMRKESGRLSVASVFMGIIVSILDLYKDPDVKAYLKRKNIKFLNLIHDAVREKVSRY